MKKSKLLLFLLCIGLLSCNPKDKNHTLTNERSTFYEMEALLEDGDLIFRTGVGLSSKLVNLTDRKTGYSHVGVAIRDSNSWLVVHALPGSSFNKVICSSLEVFLNKKQAKQGQISRVQAPYSLRKKAAQFAYQFALQKIPFDHNYNYEDSTAIYCTELVQRSFQKVGIDLVGDRLYTIPLIKRSHRVILPSSLLEDTKLTTIYNYPLAELKR